MGEGFAPERPEVIVTFSAESGLEGLRLVTEGLRYRECIEYFRRQLIMDEEFIARVKEWNLTDPEADDPDEILPISVESLGVLITPQLAVIKTAWLNKCAGRPDSFLEQESNNGDMSEVESLPMESL